MERRQTIEDLLIQHLKMVKSANVRYYNICKESANDTDGSKYQSKYGVRYFELVRLPYIDLVQMTVVDPMHNVFLGTTKFLLKKSGLQVPRQERSRENSRAS